MIFSPAIRIPSPGNFCLVFLCCVAGCFSAAAQTPVAWGWNQSGEVTIPALPERVLAVSAGNSHSLALLADGTVAAWGGNSYQQVSVPAGLSGVTAIAAGVSHSLALRDDGTVLVWGRPENGAFPSSSLRDSRA